MYPSKPNRMHSDLYQQAPDQVTRKKCKGGHEIVGAFLCCVVGIILFSLIMSKDAWYWGLIAGIGGYIVLRAFYGCYINSFADQHHNTKPPVTTITAPTEVVIHTMYRSDEREGIVPTMYRSDEREGKLAPIYEEDPTPPSL